MALELQHIDTVWAERLGYEYDDFVRRKMEHQGLEYKYGQPVYCRFCKQNFVSLQEMLTVRCLTERTTY